mmetsp:Transcript_25494/g.33309  ORF Transcript_25494/g.33309 Transcript_25494/m.33309 type:complete len:441 (+) Transcript_25494:138-1460(+)
MWSLLKKDLSEFVQTVTTDTSTTIKEVVQKIPAGDNSSNVEDKMAASQTKLQGAALKALQMDIKTYQEEISEKEALDFRMFENRFDISKKTTEISELLQSNPVVTQLHTQLVPDSIPYEVFWSRYYFRIERLQNPRAAAFVDAEEESDDELGWGQEDLEGEEDEGPPISTTKSDESIKQNLPEEDVVRFDDGQPSSSAPTSGQDSNAPGLPDIDAIQQEVLHGRITELEALVQDLQKSSSILNEELDKGKLEKEKAVKSVRDSLAADMAALRLKLEGEAEEFQQKVKVLEKQLAQKETDCKELQEKLTMLSAQTQTQEEVSANAVSIAEKDEEIKKLQRRLEEQEKKYEESHCKQQQAILDLEGKLKSTQGLDLKQMAAHEDYFAKTKQKTMANILPGEEGKEPNPLKHPTQADDSAIGSVRDAKVNDEEGGDDWGDDDW